eukprot:5883511-Amphidinium_carterae.2
MLGLSFLMSRRLKTEAPFAPACYGETFCSEVINVGQVAQRSTVLAVKVHELPRFHVSLVLLSLIHI